MTAKYVDAPSRSAIMPPLAPLITPLLEKSCTVFQISLCHFSLTSTFCNYANTIDSCTCKCNHCSFNTIYCFQ